jgi:hypothetical protein
MTRIFDFARQIRGRQGARENSQRPWMPQLPNSSLDKARGDIEEEEEGGRVLPASRVNPGEIPVPSHVSKELPRNLVALKVCHTALDCVAHRCEGVQILLHMTKNQSINQSIDRSIDRSVNGSIEVPHVLASRGQTTQSGTGRI